MNRQQGKRQALEVAMATISAKFPLESRAERRKAAKRLAARHWKEINDQLEKSRQTVTDANI